jgi:hypothetical protein
LHIESTPGLSASTADGNVEAGTYAYRVVWNGSDNTLLGMDFSGNKAITTTGTAGVDKAIQVQGLPVTDGPKYVYRTDKSGTGPYQLVGVISDGKSGSIIDNTADADRNGTRLTGSFQSVATDKVDYDITLSNVSAIRPPAY